MLAILAAPASAAEFTVTTTADSFDGACTPAKCSLRDAVQAANQDATKDTVVLPAGLLRLELGGPPEDESKAGDLDVKKPLVIRGAGAGATTVRASFSPGSPDRVIDSFSTELTLIGLTVAGGQAVSNGNRDGGGIRSLNGALELDGVVVRENTVFAEASGSAFGAGVFKDGGRLDARNSAIVANDAGFSGSGGGLGFSQTVSANLTNVTIAQNRARLGGGLFSNNEVGGEFAFVTVVENQATEIAGAFAADFGDLSIRSSIVAGNTGPEYPNCEPFANLRPVSAGGNVADPSCTFLLPTDVVTADPGLAPLGGAGIPVAEPLSSSPAIDRGLAPCPATDARSVTRPQGGGCDSGAAERPVPAPPTPPAGSGGGSNGQAKKDEKAKIGGLSVSRTSFRAGPKLAGRKGKAAPVGTTIRFNLSAAASVKTDVFRLVNGRLVGGICKPPTPARRKKPPCARQAIAGSLGSKSFGSGAGSIEFTGRVGGRNLAPGRYVVQLTVAGGGSTVTTPTLHIVR